MVKTFKSFVCELKRSAGMVSIYFTQGKFNTVKFGNSFFSLCVHGGFTNDNIHRPFACLTYKCCIP